MFASYWRGRHDSVASSDSNDGGDICAKRMQVSKLREFLSNRKPDVLLCSKQCGLLSEAMHKVALWLDRWERTALPAPFVQDLLTIAAKGVRLLDKFENVTPSSWLTTAASKIESREEFEEIFIAFLQALSSYVEVMQGSLPHANTHVYRLPLNMSSQSFSLGDRSRNQICMHALSLISDLEKDFWLLHLTAAEDRRALFHCLETGNFKEDEELRIAQLLMEVLQDDKHNQIKPLQLNSSSVMFTNMKDLGKGSFGEVYEATWMGMKVAVKQFYNLDSLDGELKAPHRTSHVNVMRAIAYYPGMESSKPGSKPCLLMELMKGDLSQFLRRIKEKKLKLPLPVSIDILFQIATGMAHLHSMKVMHRDLKPENILFSRWPPMSIDELHEGSGDFTAKVADFGDSRTHVHNTTHATAKRGTLCYRAPEILHAVGGDGRARYSNKVDVYSFGMVCYKLLTELDPVLSRDKASQGDYSELQIPSSVPLGLMFLMRRCWARAHQKRPSFDEICEFLALFKSIFLNTVRSEGCRPPLYMGIGDDILGKLVAFLGEEWLLEEAIQLGIKAEFVQGANRVEIDGVSLRCRVINKLATSRSGNFHRRAHQ